MLSITSSLPPFGRSQGPQCGFNLASSTTRAPALERRINSPDSHFCIKITDWGAKGHWWHHHNTAKLVTALWSFAAWKTATIFPLILVSSRSSTRGSPCSTQSTAASKVTRGVLISSRSSQQVWEAVWREGFIPQPNSSSFTGSRWTWNQPEGVECSCGSFPHQSPWNGLAPWGKALSATHFLIFLSCEWWEVRTCSLLLWISSFPSFQSRCSDESRARRHGQIVLGMNFSSPFA